MRVCLLASGSKGNAIYIESRESRILIDAGLSARDLSGRLQSLGVSGDDLHALFISHEHTDHCRGLGPISRRFRMPVYLHPATRRAIPDPGASERLQEFDAGERIDFRDLRIETIPLTHDAVAPVGFVIETSEGKIGIVTDLGIATRLVVQRLQGCRILVVESNHDEAMLRDGPYPWPLKQRIRSSHGHLSNAAAAKLLEDLLWEGLEAVFLAHLSEVNNLPTLAEADARRVIDRQDRCRPHLIVGSQAHPSACFAAGASPAEGALTALPRA